MKNIKISDLSKSYDGKAVFTNLSVSFYEGINYIKGASGCGKTTLVKIMAGLEQADSGQIEGIVGNVTFFFQEARLLPHFNVLENIYAVSKNRKFAEETAKEMLLFLGFTEGDLKKKPSELSGGMQQRASFVRALVFLYEQGGNTVIFDEPYKGLDEVSKEKIAELIDKIKDKIIIIIAHELADTNIHVGKTVNFNDLI